MSKTERIQAFPKQGSNMSSNSQLIIIKPKQQQENTLSKASQLSKATHHDFQISNQTKLLKNNVEQKESSDSSTPSKDEKIDETVEMQQILSEKESERMQQTEDIEKQFSKKQKMNDLQDESFKSKGLQRLSTTSTFLEDEYFGEDDMNKQKKRDKFVNPDTFNRLRDHHVDWNTTVFVEILWYHIAYYLLIGPLINIIYFKRRILMRNLQFWGSTRAFYFQSTIYFFNVCIITLYFTLGHQNIYLVEIIFTFVILLLRSYVIACKYATLHPDKIKLYRDFILDAKQTVTDYYLTNWISQDPFTIYRETYNALQRGEYDSAMFYLSFFVEPNPQVQEKIYELNEEIGKNHKYSSSKYQPDCLFEKTTSKQYYGYSIFGYIIRQFISKNGNGSQTLKALLVALIRTMVPIVYRYVYRDKFMFQMQEIFQLTALSLNNFFGYFTSFLFLFFFIRDMQMKNYILNQCKLILQVKKLQLNETKILPTIDIINPYSLKAWSILRRISLDYGKQFQLRMQAILTIYFFTVIVTLGILVLWMLKIYQLDSIYPVICLSELLLTFTTLMLILFWGSLINECFPAFKNTLGDHRVLFLDLIRMRTIYFKKGIIGQTNFVIKKSILKIKDELQLKDNEYNEEMIMARLNQLIQSISDCENELEQDFRNQPFQLYGITITLPLFQRLAVGIFTLAAGLVQIYLFMNKAIKLG